MSKIWVVVLGVVALGFAIFLLLPHLLPEREPAAETEATVEKEIPEAPQAIIAQPEPEQTESDVAAQAEEPPVAPSYAIDGEIAPDEYPHTMEIAGVTVSWANDATYLRVGLSAPGTGYVSIGFDPVRQMEGANYILGYVQDGEAYFRDDFGTEPTEHMADADRGGTSDIVASAGAEWADRTILEFIIPLDSGDAMDKPLVPGEVYTVLVAYHDLQDGFTARHSRRGTGEIRLDPAP